jgi:hypothetical protein
MSVCFVLAGYSGLGGGSLVALNGASFAPLTLCGLIHLLNLRALTSLHLSFVAAYEVDALRIRVEKAGRTSLRIERIVPLNRRSLLQRHWIDAASFNDDA